MADRRGDADCGADRDSAGDSADAASVLGQTSPRVANILQTIPSLALFGFLLPLPWLGERAARIAITALTAYALLPILRNTYAGIRGVDSNIIDVAKAIGMSDLQRLMKVELPLAASFILAGLRTATVICVGIATIAAAVGAGGLGEFIFRGVASVDNRLVLAGALPAAGLALAADGLLGLLERWVRVPSADDEICWFCYSHIGAKNRARYGAPAFVRLAGGLALCALVLIWRLLSAPPESSRDWREELYGTGDSWRIAGAGD